MSATAQKRLNVMIADFYPRSLSVVQLTVASDYRLVLSSVEQIHHEHNML